MKVLRALVASALMLSAGTFAAAHPAEHVGMRANHFRGEHSLAGLIQKLDLTQAQRENIRGILDASQAQRKALSDQHHATMKASLTTLPDDPNYLALVEKRKQLASEAIQQRSDLNSQIYALLTPEQKAQVPQLIEQVKAQMQERRGQRKQRNPREAQL
jgi:Spy/CpxP family protein refolding chaperone